MFLVDGLYGSDNAITAVLRFRSFGTNWTAGVLASQDPLAIDSVVVDILRNEPLIFGVRGALDDFADDSTSP